jgi:hypothetical protein
VQLLAAIAARRVKKVACQARRMNACNDVFPVTDRAEHECDVRFRGQNALEDVNVEFAVFGRKLCRRHTAHERPAKADGERGERAAKPLSHNKIPEPY